MLNYNAKNQVMNYIKYVIYVLNKIVVLVIDWDVSIVFYMSIKGITMLDQRFRIFASSLIKSCRKYINIYLYIPLLTLLYM